MSVVRFTRIAITRPGVDLSRQALRLEQQDEVIVLPVIRRDVDAAAPGYGEQAIAVGELIGIVRDSVLPRVPLISLQEGATLLHRLEAAAATLRGLAEKGDAR
jgi:hypothetical protein